MAVTGPLSPCINVCSLDEQDYCRGCLRSRGEIATWIMLGPEQQWAVIRATEERRRRRSGAAGTAAFQHQETGT
jgi:predicted Fe-S protein YdhL (DUF1289 family)